MFDIFMVDFDFVALRKISPDKHELACQSVDGHETLWFFFFGDRHPSDKKITRTACFEEQLGLGVNQLLSVVWIPESMQSPKQKNFDC